MCTWYGGVFEDAAVEEVHDVEIATNDLLILTEDQCSGYWDICLLQCVDDSVLAVDLVGSL